MSPLFKVGDLVVRNPEARGESDWPYDDAVCRVVGHYPNLNEIIVVPVNSPPNKRYQGTGWMADRFTPAYMFTGIEPPKEVMRITRDGIRVAVGVSVDEAAQAVLNALSVEIRRLVDVARADDTALLRQALAALEAALSDDQPYIVQSKEVAAAIKEFLE